ncbi:MAG TPA: nitrate reductase associated protein [Fibrobacteria bacterium]|jgi:hypothetical protein|nr:nitrate reductase associated protein [Fibrobacteria bacterium]
MTARYFDFESDFVATLRCVPMCVRYKLDLAGIKLKLNEWSKMDSAERAYLADMPCGTREEIRGFRDFTSLLVRINCGAMPSLMTPPEASWDSAEAPAQVTEKAAALGAAVPSATWASLDVLQRFALIKLSRPGHEGANFAPALREFGIVA